MASRQCCTAKGGAINREDRVNNIEIYLNKINNGESVVLYGHGVLGKLVEEHIRINRMDIRIVRIVDDFSAGEETIAFNEYCKSKKENELVIICIEDDKLFRDIAKKLSKNGIRFYDKIYKRPKSGQKPIWQNFLLSPLFQILIILTTPYRVFQALWSCRVLLAGKWKQYNRFSSHRGINSLFYWTQAYNLDRFGRNGKSSLAGLGEYRLSRWFQLSLLSLYLYWGLGGSVAVLLGMFGWLFSHTVWVGYVDIYILLLVMVIAFFSATFYANTFEMQNYNAIGWAFFPLGVYGLYTGDWLIASIGWLLVSFGSFTAVFIAGLLSAIMAVSTFSLTPLYAFLPTVLKISTHFVPLVKERRFFKQLKETLGLLGGSKKEAKHKRAVSFYRFRLIYMSFLYIQFQAVLFLATGVFDPLFCFLVILFALNESKVFRFADPGSFYIPFMSLSIALFLMYPSIWLFVSLLFLLNPPATTLDFVGHNSPMIVPEREPFFITPLLEASRDFLGTVPNGKKILLCFFDPGVEYSKVFLGGRPLMELFIYESNKRSIHFFPDFYALAELNYHGAPNLWIKNYKDVQGLKKQWNADLVVLMTPEEKSVSELESESGYSQMAEINWKKTAKDLNIDVPYQKGYEVWHLMG